MALISRLWRIPLKKNRVADALVLKIRVPTNCKYYVLKSIKFSKEKWYTHFEDVAYIFVIEIDLIFYRSSKVSLFESHEYF